MAALGPSAFGKVSFSKYTDSSDLDIDLSDMMNHLDQNFPLARGRAMWTIEVNLVVLFVKIILIGRFWHN